MERTLTKYHIDKIKTNLTFHHQIIHNTSFHEKHYNTSFIEREKAELLRPLALEDNKTTLNTTLLTTTLHNQNQKTNIAHPTDRPTKRNAWQHSDHHHN